MKKQVGAISLVVLLLTGCSSVSKDNTQACDAQIEIYNKASGTESFSLEVAGELAALSRKATELAEPDLALQLSYQTDFMDAMADPKTKQGWTPSQEMNNATKQIGEICRSLGFTFD